MMKWGALVIEVVATTSQELSDSDFNPHSPIGYRYYVAWSGGPGYVAYGYRAGRKAP